LLRVSSLPRAGCAVDVGRLTRVDMVVLYGCGGGFISDFA
jgi:hypothetical protein